MSKVLPHQFSGWIHREDCVSTKAFNTYGEARRFGESDNTIIRISKTDDDCENEMTIYKRLDTLNDNDLHSTVHQSPPVTLGQQVAWLREEIVNQLGCTEQELDIAMSCLNHRAAPNYKLYAAEQNVRNLEEQVEQLEAANTDVESMMDKKIAESEQRMMGYQSMCQSNTGR